MSATNNIPGDPVKLITTSGEDSGSSSNLNVAATAAKVADSYVVPKNLYSGYASSPQYLDSTTINHITYYEFLSSTPLNQAEAPKANQGNSDNSVKAKELTQCEAELKSIHDSVKTNALKCLDQLHEKQIEELKAELSKNKTLFENAVQELKQAQEKEKEGLIAKLEEAHEKEKKDAIQKLEEQQAKIRQQQEQELLDPEIAQAVKEYVEKVKEHAEKVKEHAEKVKEYAEEQIKQQEQEFKINLDIAKKEIEDSQNKSFEVKIGEFNASIEKELENESQRKQLAEQKFLEEQERELEAFKKELLNAQEQEKKTLLDKKSNELNEANKAELEQFIKDRKDQILNLTNSLKELEKKQTEKLTQLEQEHEEARKAIAPDQLDALISEQTKSRTNLEQQFEKDKKGISEKQKEEKETLSNEEAKLKQEQEGKIKAQLAEEESAIASRQKAKFENQIQKKRAEHQQASEAKKLEKEKLIGELKATKNQEKENFKNQLEEQKKLDISDLIAKKEAELREALDKTIKKQGYLELIEEQKKLIEEQKKLDISDLIAKKEAELLESQKNEHLLKLSDEHKLEKATRLAGLTDQHQKAVDELNNKYAKILKTVETEVEKLPAKQAEKKQEFIKKLEEMHATLLNPLSKLSTEDRRSGLNEEISQNLLQEFVPVLDITNILKKEIVGQPVIQTQEERKQPQELLFSLKRTKSDSSVQTNSDGTLTGEHAVGEPKNQQAAVNIKEEPKVTDVTSETKPEGNGGLPGQNAGQNVVPPINQQEEPKNGVLGQGPGEKSTVENTEEPKNGVLGQGPGEKPAVENTEEPKNGVLGQGPEEKPAVENTEEPKKTEKVNQPENVKPVKKHWKTVVPAIFAVFSAVVLCGGVLFLIPQYASLIGNISQKAVTAISGSAVFIGGITFITASYYGVKNYRNTPQRVKA